MKKYVNGEYVEVAADEIAEFEKEKVVIEATEASRPLTDAEIYEMFIKQNIDSLQVDDTMAVRMKTKYPEWESGIAYAVDTRRIHKGSFYKCITAHTSQADWTPDAAVSLWVRIDDPAIEYPDWRQPTGAHDAYAKSAKVSHNGAKWVNTEDVNVYEPGVYGWIEVITNG